MGNMIYSSAIIACRDSKIITPERIKRMINAETFADSAKILFECGYDSERLLLPKATDIEVIIQNEFEKTIEDFKKYCADETIKKIALTQYDYHNAKVVYKTYNQKCEKTEMYYFSYIAEGMLRRAVRSKKYGELPNPMREAFETLDKLREASTADIDLLVEKAMFKDIVLQLKKIKNKTIQKYYKSQIDLINMRTFAKCRMAGASIKKLDEYFIEGGFLSKSEITPIFSNDKNYIGVVDNKAYKGLMDVLQECFLLKDISIFEDYSSNFLVDLSQEGKTDIFGIGLLFSWLVLKLEELKVVKIILLGQKLDYSKRQYRDMLKGVYERFR